MKYFEPVSWNCYKKSKNGLYHNNRAQQQLLENLRTSTQHTKHKYFLQPIHYSLHFFKLTIACQTSTSFFTVVPTAFSTRAAHLTQPRVWRAKEKKRTFQQSLYLLRRILD